MRVLLIFVIAATAFASWDDVARLSNGQRVKVTEKNGSNHTAEFAGATDTTLMVVERGKQTGIARDQIRRIQVKAAGRRVRNFAIGAGIGLAMGITTDQTLGRLLRNEGGETPGARAATIIAPAAIFGAIGAALPGYKTIYSSK